MDKKQNDLAQQAEEQYLKILAEEQRASASKELKLDLGQCQDGGSAPCIDLLACPDFLATMQFAESQEASVQAVISLSEASRGRVLERLWERAVARLIAEEAERVLREAQPE